MKIEKFTIEVATRRTARRDDIIKLISGLAKTVSGVLAVEIQDETETSAKADTPKRMGRPPKAETVEKPRKRMGRPPKAPKTEKPVRTSGVSVNGEKFERRKLEDGTVVEIRK